MVKTLFAVPIVKFPIMLFNDAFEPVRLFRRLGGYFAKDIHARVKCGVVPGQLVPVTPIELPLAQLLGRHRAVNMRVFKGLNLPIRDLRGQLKSTSFAEGDAKVWSAATRRSVIENKEAFIGMFFKCEVFLYNLNTIKPARLRFNHSKKITLFRFEQSLTQLRRRLR